MMMVVLMMMMMMMMMPVMIVMLLLVLSSRITSSYYALMPLAAQVFVKDFLRTHAMAAQGHEDVSHSWCFSSNISSA